MVVEPAISLLVNSVSHQQYDSEGTEHLNYDPEMLMYRMFHVDTDNFPAYISAHKYTITMANEIEKSCNTNTGRAMCELMKEITTNNLISLTGLSSKDGQLFKSLLMEKQESIVKMQTDPGGKSIMDTIKANTGQNNPMGQPQPVY